MRDTSNRDRSVSTVAAIRAVLDTLPDLYAQLHEAQGKHRRATREEDARRRIGEALFHVKHGAQLALVEAVVYVGDQLGEVIARLDEKHADAINVHVEAPSGEPTAVVDAIRGHLREQRRAGR